jgi:ribosomal protein S1
MQGVVTKISHDGLVISLWGDMRGFAPRSHLSTETIEYPEKLFFVGQVRFSFKKLKYQ